MKNDNTVRCIAVLSKGQWSAICLEYNLTAQAESLGVARDLLHAQISDYIREAYGVDLEHKEILLNRGAPFSYWLAYYTFRILRFPTVNMWKCTRVKYYDEASTNQSVKSAQEQLQDDIASGRIVVGETPDKTD